MKVHHKGRTSDTPDHRTLPFPRFYFIFPSIPSPTPHSTQNPCPPIWKNLRIPVSNQTQSVSQRVRAEDDEGEGVQRGERVHVAEAGAA